MPETCSCSPLEDIVQTAALNWKNGPGVLSALLPQMKDFHITENVLKILARYCDSEIMTLALSRNENVLVMDAVLEAALDNEIILRKWTELDEAEEYPLDRYGGRVC